MNSNIEECIYVLSVFSECKEYSEGYLGFHDSRSVCWKASYDEVRQVLIHSKQNINRGIYIYAVIEKLPCCLYPTASTQYERQFFKWNSFNNSYEPTDEIENILKKTQVSPTFSIG